MAAEKERLSGSFLMPSWVRTEHYARYVFAAEYCTGKIVIDCACGNGEGTALFAAKALRVNAFDIADEALKEARQHLNVPHVFFAIGNATNLPLIDASADVYISLETIEHLYEDTLYVKEAKRVLKAGGIFICSTPNRSVTNPGTMVHDKPTNEFHVREYSENEFTSLLQTHFKTVEVYGQNPVNTWNTLLLEILGRVLPRHTATRLHQLQKLLLHFFRNNTYYRIRHRSEAPIFEYLTAVCTKN